MSANANQPNGLSGKFGQYKRDIPYATLAQAFQSLVRPLLSKGEDDLRKWRDALREALEPNGPRSKETGTTLPAASGYGCRRCASIGSPSSRSIRSVRPR
jgi:predicted ATPase